MLESLQQFTEGLPPLLQWGGIALIAMIPFVESYLGSAIGVLAGLHPVVAIVAAIVGNVISMVLFVLLTAAGREALTQEADKSPRKARMRRVFDRWGVPGVSLLGQTLLPSQITSAAMVGFGADRRQVILWQCISIVLWGVAFGTLAAQGVNLVQ